MNEKVWQFCDEFGPQKVVYIHNPRVNLKSIVVVDNIAMGPAIGGVRMAEDVTLDECARLARAMTLKNASADLPHGGGKTVIVANPKIPQAEKELLVRAFAVAIERIEEYIPGPDMGTNEHCMAWVHDEIGRAVGLPASLGGIPLDEIGATGFGLAFSIIAAESFCDVRVRSARVAVQGFGSVGQHAARFLVQRGAQLVAAADSRGTVSSREGLDVDALVQHKLATGGVSDFPGAINEGAEAIIDVECDIWIPAARPDVIDRNNVDRLKTRLVAQGANIPVTLDAERMLEQRGVTVLPDFIANAGGVICASVEYHGGNRTEAFVQIEEKIARNTVEMFEHAQRNGLSTREAASQLAENRIRDAMCYSRWHRQ
jgi:glutamate dehydrogenase (NAD(P)+)